MDSVAIVARAEAHTHAEAEASGRSRGAQLHVREGGGTRVDVEYTRGHRGARDAAREQRRQRTWERRPAWGSRAEGPRDARRAGRPSRIARRKLG